MGYRKLNLICATLFVEVVLAACLSVAQASPWQNGVPNDAFVVQRVSECGPPHPAMMWGTPMRCSVHLNDWLRGSEYEQEPCGFPFRPPYAPFSADHMKLYIRPMPEWDTAPVGRRGSSLGPGMNGIVSATCEFNGDGSPIRRPPESTLFSVGVVRVAEKGRTHGTATRIGRDLVLTAWHVACPNKEVKVTPTVAVFRRPRVAAHVGRSESTATSFEEENDFDLVVSGNDLVIVAGSPNTELDYAVLRLSTSGARAAAITKALEGHPSLASTVWLESLERGARTHLLGFTDNVFFPRGLVLSTFGSVVGRLPVGDLDRGLDTFYNLASAGGFSGGPVFDDQFRWRAMHLTALSYDTSPDTARDFSRPNAGVSIQAIMADLGKQWGRTLGSLDELQTIADQTQNPLLTTCSKGRSK